MPSDCEYIQSSFQGKHREFLGRRITNNELLEDWLGDDLDDDILYVGGNFSTYKGTANSGILKVAISTGVRDGSFLTPSVSPRNLISLGSRVIADDTTVVNRYKKSNGDADSPVVISGSNIAIYSMELKNNALLISGNITDMGQSPNFETTRDYFTAESPFKLFTSVAQDQSPQPVSGVMGQTVTVPDMELYIFSFGLSDYLSAGISGTLKVNVWDSVSKTTLIGTSSEMDASVLTSSTYSAVFGFQGISLSSGSYFFELDYSGITDNVNSLAIQRSNVSVYFDGTLVINGTMASGSDAVFVVEGFDS